MRTDQKVVEMKMGVGAISRAKKGFTANGDAYLVEEIDQGILIGLIDGIGHGDHAERAATICVKTIRDYIRSREDFTLTGLFYACDDALRATDGVVMAVVIIKIDEGRIHFAGVGNITTRIIGSENSYPISTGGIIGYNMQRVIEHTYPYTSGDLILMHSDGIRSGINRELLLRLCSQDEERIADALFREYARGTDDATIVVARERRSE
ncbi:MAG TPA: hypothetical protein ENL17_03040 [Candidatus Methanoperedenaceae archaeon]|nr:hypothetical protein [Candidatus Methanoperedenaceae archaeon]